MDHEALIDKLYTEMAEFSFLTPYLFASDVEEININSWKDTKITYAMARGPLQGAVPSLSTPWMWSAGCFINPG